jgi:nickel transport protein
MFAGILGINNLQALALPEEQVVKTLREVPVFTLTNSQGEFVVISRKNQSKTISQIGFFLSKKDAQTFLENRLKKENSQLASTIQIKPVSLADYYKLVVENNKKKDSNLVFTLVPTQQQVKQATTMLNTTDKTDKKFNGIPLFVPKFKKENSYLTIPQGKERFIPFYFEKEQAVALLEAFKKAKPQESTNTEIQVLDLYNVIETLNSSNDPNTNKILLFPSQESIEFIRSLAPAQPKK